MQKIVDFGELRSDGDRFEHVVTRILERKGFKMIRKRAIGQDAGRDFVFVENLQSQLKLKTRKWVVQCKLSASNVVCSGVRDIDKTIKQYSSGAYLLVVSSDVTESLMNYLHSLSGEYDVERWTYHELEEELLLNLDLFSEYFPKSYLRYMERWTGKEVDITNRLEVTNQDFSGPLAWDSTRRWQTYHGRWYKGKLQVKLIKRTTTIYMEKSKETDEKWFAIALYGEMHKDEHRLINICKPTKLVFSYKNLGEFVCHLEITGEDRRPYFLAYVAGVVDTGPYITHDGISGYANYNIGTKKTNAKYIKVERLVSEDLMRLYSVAPLLVNRICFTTERNARIKDLKIFG